MKYKVLKEECRTIYGYDNRPGNTHHEYSYFVSTFDTKEAALKHKRNCELDYECLYLEYYGPENVDLKYYLLDANEYVAHLEKLLRIVNLVPDISKLDY